MKTLKTLCTIVGAIAVLYSGAAFGTQQKFNVPEYNLEGIKETIEYSAITPFGLTPIEDPNNPGKWPILVTKKYFVDRNKDGKNDLVHVELIMPEDADSKQPSHVIKQLYIDDDFNGYIERILIDDINEEGDLGADGIYDEQRDALRVEDLK